MADDREPIDLEPVDLEPIDHEWRSEQDRGRPPRWIWAAIVGAGLAVWAMIALATGGGSSHSTPPSTSTPPRATAPVNRIAALAPELHQGLQGLRSGRYAAIIDNRLYLFDKTRPVPTLVPLPEGDPTIQDQSGRSLLLSTSRQSLVSARTTDSRLLSSRDTAIRAVAPRAWWLLRNDGTIRSDEGGRIRRVPTGLRVVAAVRAGFVALDPRSGWVLWSGSTIVPIAPAGGQFLAAGPRTVVLKYGCGYNGCSLRIVDLVRGTVRINQMSRVAEYAAFSPNGTRLALASTLGDVYILDPRTGRVITQIRGVAENPSLPFSWTPDSRELLVVRTHDVRILRASDGFATGVIAQTDGLEQLVALP